MFFRFHNFMRIQERERRGLTDFRARAAGFNPALVGAALKKL
jgi:hypothetical protein